METAGGTGATASPVAPELPDIRSNCSGREVKRPSRFSDFVAVFTSAG